MARVCCWGQGAAEVAWFGSLSWECQVQLGADQSYSTENCACALSLPTTLFTGMDCRPNDNETATVSDMHAF